MQVSDLYWMVSNINRDSNRDWKQPDQENGLEPELQITTFRCVSCLRAHPFGVTKVLFLFLHGFTSGLWSVTVPSPDAPGPWGQGMSICYNRALAAELLSSSPNCVKNRCRGSNPRPLARYCSHKAVLTRTGIHQFAASAK